MNIPEHQYREKEVIDFMSEAATEGNIIFLKDDKGNDRISQRIQMIIAFSIMDVMANYWCEYLGESKKPSEKVCLWYEKFCLTEDNEEYKRDKQWALLTSARMYRFRNSAIHFWGLSETTDDVYITLTPNDTPKKERLQLIDAFKSKDKNTIIIKPGDFYILVKKGAIAMLNSWAETIQASHNDSVIKQEYINGIERVWNKFKREGAVKIY